MKFSIKSSFVRRAAAQAGATLSCDFARDRDTSREFEHERSDPKAREVGEAVE